jgi:hypothetical protein
MGMGYDFIALLGRRDEPTDVLEDYCTGLGRALAKGGHERRLVRVLWKEIGWLQALRWLWRESAGWKGKWGLVQYTAFARQVTRSCSSPAGTDFSR